jgi:GTP-binding protein
MFIDYVKIYVQAGHGGSGCMSFHREKFVEKGGPDGGDGGRGGSVILQVNPQLHTLQDYSYKKKYKAQRGQHGMGSNRHGKSGKDVILEVPVGTIVKNFETGEILTDLVNNNDRFVVAKGGKGGRGNARFATPTHRAPREWEVGELGKEFWIELELKLIADIGLVGLPNAGKSTLLSVISAARPKIADYPFTTLEPNLGIVDYHDTKKIVVADIPGLIEGAHEGKGLGHQFLRHIERTRALAFLIDINDENPAETYKILFAELENYSSILTAKPILIVLTKIDIFQGDSKKIRFKSKFPVTKISAITGQNIDVLKESFNQLIIKAGQIENETEMD